MKAVPLIAEFLNLMLPERYPALLMAPEQKRRRLFAALSGWVFGAARLQPLVIVLEDLQWVDPSTPELIQMLAEQGAMVPLLLLCTARPEFRAPWPIRAHHAQLTLNRLSDTQAREMVGPAAGHAALGVETLEAVIKRATGGAPVHRGAEPTGVGERRPDRVARNPVDHQRLVDGAARPTRAR